METELIISIDTSVYEDRTRQRRDDAPEQRFGPLAKDSFGLHGYMFDALETADGLEEHT